jgi:PPM family protein phosphatase
MPKKSPNESIDNFLDPKTTFVRDTPNDDWEIGTNRGRKRENNEDNYAEIETIGLYVVCDGMGGMAAGEKASEIGKDSILKWFQTHFVDPKETNSTEITEKEFIWQSLDRSIRFANEAIRTAVRDNPDWHGMGTTTVIGWVINAQLYLASVGDSRAYLIRKGVCRLLTEDDSVAAVLLKRGEMDAEEARTSPLRNQLLSGLGDLSKAGPHLYEPIQLHPKDRVILCSDGLWDMLEDDQIGVLTMSAITPRDAVTTLIDAANKQGGLDNITVAALFFDTLVASENEIKETEEIPEPITLRPEPIIDSKIKPNIIFEEKILDTYEKDNLKKEGIYNYKPEKRNKKIFWLTGTVLGILGMVFYIIYSGKKKPDTIAIKPPTPSAGAITSTPGPVLLATSTPSTKPSPSEKLLKPQPSNPKATLAPVDVPPVRETPMPESHARDLSASEPSFEEQIQRIKKIMPPEESVNKLLEMAHEDNITPERKEEVWEAAVAKASTVQNQTTRKALKEKIVQERKKKAKIVERATPAPPQDLSGKTAK